ncbi:MAG: 30S ribosomal protein S6 [Candidatus Omnitrophica bacterium]|nr:30S ribosomal protein S6 [Candidatus Omnitrophota bacterium]
MNMKEYEVLFIVDSDKEEQEKNAISAIHAMIEKENGRVIKEESWGKKTLVYPIRKRKDGAYYKINFSLDPAKLDTLNKSYKLNQDILRVMIVKK